MNIDFHYGVIYVVARLGGMNVHDAEVVAHACQYVDDATTAGLLKFADGQTFERFATAHKLFDYKNADNDENRVVWVPFHFLPAAEGDTLDDKAVCRPNSQVAKEVVRRALANTTVPNGLHRLGVTLHVYVDTWAHQGFSGIESKHNRVCSLECEHQGSSAWLEKLSALLEVELENIGAEILDLVSGLGHGAALHYPDMPWAQWRYTNAHQMEVKRHNLRDFIEAANMACKVIQAYLAKTTDFESQAGLPAQAQPALAGVLGSHQDHDAALRFETFCHQVLLGAIPGIKETVPPYIGKGVGSWKHQATHIEVEDDGDILPEWSQCFEDSHYRKFHDAVKEHRFVVTEEILPIFGLRLA